MSATLTPLPPARPSAPARAPASPRADKAPSIAAQRRSQALIGYSVLVLGSLLFLIPFYFVAVSSLKTEAEVARGTLHQVPLSWFASNPKGDPSGVDRLSPKTREQLQNALGQDMKLLAVEVTGEIDYRALARSTKVETFGGKEYRREVDYMIAPQPDGTPVVSSADPQWGNFAESLSERKMNFWPALANTVVITAVCVAGQIISCSLVGFGFARFRFRGRDLLFIVMLSTMMLPAQVTMIPVFVLFKSLGMIDSFWPLILPAWFASPFFVFMFRQFFAQVPEELIEAARIDGCSNWRIYWQMMLPLSGPVIAIVAIFTFLGTWNDFMGPLIYLNDPANRTIALALNSFKGQYGTSDVQLLMAASVVCMLPCIVLFFAAQRYFVESVASTGLKS
jgi:ABC-type glycerol-3-phosphate transport system permease component